MRHILPLLILLASLSACQPGAGQALATGEQTLAPLPSIPAFTPTLAEFQIPSPGPLNTPPPPHGPAPSPTAAHPGPAPLQSATPSSTGTLFDYTLNTSLLPRPLEYRVYLPPAYQANPSRRYPVLYLLHGQTYDQTQWDRLGAPAAADRLISTGELPPFLMVFPSDPDWRQPDSSRFAQALVNELIPTIDQAYRTLVEPRYRAVGGLSRGAAWAVHLALTRPDLFGRLGAHSLPLFTTDIPHIPAWLDEISPAQMPGIYLDIGRADQETLSAQQFADLLDERAIPHTWRLNPGAHDEAYWSAHVEEYLRFYAQEWEVLPPEPQD